MCRLSIVVPLLSDPDGFEDTLASVLQNRPAACEVLVVHRGPYDDPYELDGEVRFIEAPAAASPVATIARALTAAAGTVVHVLQAGTLAIEGWTEAACARFAEPDVGAVSPLVLDRADRTRVVTAGVRITATGRRRMLAGGWGLQSVARLADDDFTAPTLAAAFYRRSAVCEVGGLSEYVGLRYADADLALRLRAAGQRSVLEPDSQILGAPESLPARSFDTGRCAERFYWRHAARRRGFAHRLVHGLAVFGDWLTHVHRLGAHAQLLGRFAAWTELRHCRDVSAGGAPRDDREEEAAAPDALRPATPPPRRVQAKHAA